MGVGAGYPTRVCANEVFPLLGRAWLLGSPQRLEGRVSWSAFTTEPWKKLHLMKMALPPPSAPQPSCSHSSVLAIHQYPNGTGAHHPRALSWTGPRRHILHRMATKAAYHALTPTSAFSLLCKASPFAIFQKNPLRPPPRFPPLARD